MKQDPNLNHLVEPSFKRVIIIFVLPFENTAQRTSNSGYYLPNIELKDYNVMINRDDFFDQPVKDNKVIYESITKIATGQGHDYITGGLLDYPHFKDSYKMFAVDFRKQTELDAQPRETHQIIFNANLDRGHDDAYTRINAETDIVLRLPSTMVGNSDDETNFLHKILLTNRQVANLCTVSSSKTSADIKLSKTQLSKMIQLGGFLRRFLSPLLKNWITINEKCNSTIN